jgi:hypothetical protein
MAAREQTCHGELYRLILAYDDLADLLYERVDMVRHAGMIWGNNVLRKHRLPSGGISGKQLLNLRRLSGNRM